MEGFEIVYSVCLNKKNIKMLIDIIREDIKLSENAIPKCASMIYEIMNRNIKRLKRAPRNKEELKKVVRHLNSLCINSIIEAIIKKYPNLRISRKKQIGQEQMKRDMDIYGERDNYIVDRPYTKSKKEYDDEITYNMVPNDIGIQGTDNFCNYASAFDNHLITNIPIGQKQVFNNQHSNRDSTQLEKRYKELVEQRNQEFGKQVRPPTPDFTLDGSGEKVRMEKMKRLQEQQISCNNVNGMYGTMGNEIPIGTSSFGMDDPYATLLAAGAPNQINQFVNGGNPNVEYEYGISGKFNNLTGSTGSNNQSVKSLQLQYDYEKKLAERQMVDIETNQPITNNNNNQMYKMPEIVNGSTSLPIIPNIITNTTSNIIPNTIPNAIQNTISSIMPNVIPNTVPNAMPNIIPNTIPNAMPNNIPNLMSQISNFPNISMSDMNLPNIMPGINQSNMYSIPSQQYQY